MNRQQSVSFNRWVKVEIGQLWYDQVFWLRPRSHGCNGKFFIVTDQNHAIRPINSESVMIAQWNSSLSVLPVARVRFPATTEYFKRFFPGWSHSHRVTFSMGHAGASRKSPNDAPWEKLSLRLSRPISAPLLTVARSWRHEKKNTLKNDIDFRPTLQLKTLIDFSTTI